MHLPQPAGGLDDVDQGVLKGIVQTMLWMGGAARWQRQRLQTRLHACRVDPMNRLQYGAAAPGFAERVWIDPMNVVEYDKRGSALQTSGRVVHGEWRLQDLQPIEDDPVWQAAHARWVERRPWELTGEVERMEHAIQRKGPIHGCTSRADILARCRRLDEIFRIVEREGRLRPQGEVELNVFREFGGIGMHLGPDGIPIRTSNGRHRFAMARILALPRIPVRIGLVHASALPLLGDFRRPPSAVSSS